MEWNPMADNPAALPVERRDATDKEAMEAYGITSVTTVTYLVGTYRYAKLADALAEAKRRAPRL